MAVPHVFRRVRRAGLWFLYVWPEALTWPPHLLQNYLPSQEGMAYNQFIKMMIIFSVAFITVLILKVSGTCSVALGGAARRGGLFGGGEGSWGGQTRGQSPVQVPVPREMVANRRMERQENSAI